MASLFRGVDEYLLDMVGRVQQLGSRITDFSIGAVARSLFEAVAAALSRQSLTAEQLRQASYIATATGDALDARAADQFVIRNPATPATGTVRISRDAGGTAVTIPAAWGELQTKPAPGQAPIAFLTTADAVFGTTDLFVDVAAQATTGGTIGNIVDQTPLLPVNPVTGFQTDGGFKAEGAFTFGTDVETDDALRTKVQKTVQGRNRGKKAAFEAQVLSVPGVETVQVLEAGDTAPGGTPVNGGHVGVYYEGAPGLASAVADACEAARVLTQNVDSHAAASVSCIASVTIYVLAGTDETAAAAAAAAAILNLINAASVGEKATYSSAIRALDTLDGVVSLTVPVSDFRKSTDPGGTAGDIDPGPGKYLLISDSDITVAVVSI